MSAVGVIDRATTRREQQHARKCAVFRDELVYLVLVMLSRRPPILFAVLVLAAAFSSGCSRAKSIERDEARSAIRSAQSFAAEAEVFVDFILQGRASRPYAAGHSAYLEDESNNG